MNSPLKRSRQDLERLQFQGRLEGIAAQDAFGSIDPLGIGTLSRQGWAEKRIRARLDFVARQFPECGFALATFEAGTQTPIKVLNAGRHDSGMEGHLESCQWQSDWLAPSDESLLGRVVPQGLAAVIVASEENKELLHAHDGRPLLIFALPGPLTAVLAVWKSVEYGPFREPEIAPLRETAQVISTLVRLGVELSIAQMTGLSSIFDRLDLGLIVVDQALRLVHANKQAAALLGKGDYATLEDNSLVFVDPMAGERVRQLADYLAAKNKHADDADGIIAIRGAGSAHLARCVMTIMRDSEDGLLGTPLLALTLSVARDMAAVDTVKLRRRGFTPAEAELIVDLLKGLTVTQHAQERGIAVATARAHLKRAMMRIGVHRQADLIRHVVSMN